MTEQTELERAQIDHLKAQTELLRAQAELARTQAAYTTRTTPDKGSS